MENKGEKKSENEQEELLIPEGLEAKVPYQEIKEVVSKLEIKDGEQFELLDLQNQIFLCPNDSGNPAEFFASTQLNGIDIYIWESLKKKGKDFVRVILLHELVESTVQDLLLDSGINDTRKREEKAHEITKIFENKYKKEVLDEKRAAKFDVFAAQLREKKKS